MSGQSQLYELAFSADAAALRDVPAKQRLVVPGKQTTVCGGLGLTWAVSLIPAGYVFSNGRKSDEVALSLYLSAGCLDDQTAVNLRAHAQLRLADGSFPRIRVHRFASFQTSLRPGQCKSLMLEGAAKMKKDARLDGRVLILLEPALLDPATLVEAHMTRIKRVDFGPVLEGLYKAGLAGDADLCDTVFVCSDGRLRAASAILKSQSHYFRNLANFKTATGGSGVTVNYSEGARYTMAVVKAVLCLVHTFAVPPLEDWAVEELTGLLELGTQVDPLLRHSVEKALLCSDMDDSATLATLATLADVHGLGVLKNVVCVCLAKKRAFCDEIGGQIKKEIWARASDMADHIVTGISYSE